MLDQKALIASAYQLQPLPASVQRLAALAVQPSADIAAMVDAVALDPVLTGRLLRVANSARNARSHQAATVKAAVVRMGSGMLLGLAMSVSTRPLVADVVPGYGMSRDDFWRHAVMCALAADIGRAFTKAPWSSAGFTAGLLHDFGKLILGKFITDEYRECLHDAVLQGDLERWQAESEVLAVNHAEVGGLIAQHWKLPDNIVQGVLHHHNPQEGSDDMACVVYAANFVAKWVHDEQMGQDMDKERLVPALARLRIPWVSMEPWCAKVAAGFRELNEDYR